MTPRREFEDEALASHHRDHYEQLENAHDRAKDEQMEADWNEMQRPYLDKLADMVPTFKEFQKKVDKDIMNKRSPF